MQHSTDLIDADDLKRKEPRHAQSFRDDNAETDRGRREDHQLRTVHVHLGGRSENDDRRLKRHHQRDRRRYHRQLPVGHDELLRRTLTVAGQRVVDADGERDDEEGDEDEVVRPF